MRRNRFIAECKQATRSVVGNGVLNSDLPVLNTGVDYFKAGDHALGGGQYIGIGDAWPHQVFFENKGNFPFCFGRDKPFADGHHFTLVKHHIVGEITKIGLVNIEHALHGFAGYTDFFTYHFGPGIDAPIKHLQRNVISIFNTDITFPGSQRCDGLFALHGVVKFIAILFD